MKNSKTFLNRILFALIILLLLLLLSLLVFINIKSNRQLHVATIENLSLNSTELVNEDKIRPTNNSNANGTILIQASLKGPEKAKGEFHYFLIDENGALISDIGAFTGASDWSNDGSKIALGCQDVNFLCILETKKIKNSREFPVFNILNQSESIIDRIALPEQCINSIDTVTGLYSISWSRNDDEIVVMCRDNHEQKRVICFIKLDGEKNCWTEKKSEMIQKLAFSPLNDTLVMSREGKIEITDLNGKTIRTLVDGINPAWSPDGQYIVFSSSFNEGPRNGIGIIDQEGNNFRWLYLQPENGEENEFLCQFCDEFNRGTISWAPNSKYIVFSAVYHGMGETHIFRMNMETGEILVLDWLANYESASIPDWGNYNFSD